MSPWLSQAVADAHRDELLRAAQRRQPKVTTTRSAEHASGTPWDARIGWMLIRIGAHLVAQRAQLPQV
jgi:hypothetical protein